jgi:hypothetical protein
MMIPHVLVYDDFFDDFDWIREHAYRLEYQSACGFDGQTYQQVSGDVPGFLVNDLSMRLTWVFGRRVNQKLTFFRLSTEGIESPQWCHSDFELSQFALFMHMNWDTGATALLRHIENGMFMHPKDEHQLSIYQQDKNNYHAWDQTTVIEGAPNRAIILRSDLLHGALPMSGLGSTVKDGRLMLVSFFDL